MSGREFASRGGFKAETLNLGRDISTLLSQTPISPVTGSNVYFEYSVGSSYLVAHG
jgi:hypothetical protein